MLEVVMIYDKETDISSAALTVGVGSYMDPSDTVGLAHFLEHMLFMGTAKYPDTKQYMEFINKHGGKTNAHTGNEYTSYYYSITNQYFTESLDIFAQFFIEPLFDKSNVDREINAVNSEHSKNITNDSWRIRRMLAQISDQQHPFHKFSTGTIDTLGHDDIRNRLIEFYNKYYSANIMKLTVLSDIPLDKLQKVVTSIFTPIKNNGYIPEKYNVTPFWFKDNNDESDSRVVARKLVKMVPIYDERMLYVIWDLPPSKKYFKYKPMVYISHLIGHEASECLAEQLRKKNWIYSLTASSFESDVSCNLFGLSIKLTDEGFKHVPSIIEYIYMYVDMITRNGIDKWRYDELKKINEIDFRFLNKIDPIDYTVIISENLLYYPYEHALDVAYFFDNYDDLAKRLYEKILSMISRRKSVVIISSKEYHDLAIKKEKFYGIKYMDKTDATTFGSEFVYRTTLDIKLELPIHNDWIPDRIELMKAVNVLNAKYPKQVDSRNMNVKLWVKQDKTFNAPNAIVYIVVCTDVLSKSIKKFCSLTVLFDSIWYTLQSDLYYASLGNTFLTFSIGIEGYTLKINTYPSMISRVLDLIIKNLFNPKIDEHAFMFNKNNSIVEMSNYVYKSPLTVANGKLAESMENVYYRDEDILECYKSLEISDMNGLIDEIKKHSFVDTLIIGNINQNTIKNVDESIAGLVVDEKIDRFVPIIKVKRIVPPICIEIDSKVQNRDERDSGIVMSYECYSINKLDDKEWAKKLGILMLIEKLVKERFFNELRTVQQSGYLVGSSLSIQGGSFDNVYTLNFNVQSSSRSLQSVQHSITEFVNDTLKFISDVSLEVYDEFKRSLVATITKKYDNIYDELFLYLGAINTYDYMFDYRAKLASELKDISRGDVLNAFEDYFVGKNKKLRVVKVYSRINRID